MEKGKSSAHSPKLEFVFGTYLFGEQFFLMALKFVTRSGVKYFFCFYEASYKFYPFCIVGGIVGAEQSGKTLAPQLGPLPPKDFPALHLLIKICISLSFKQKIISVTPAIAPFLGYLRPFFGIFNGLFWDI